MKLSPAYGAVAELERRSAARLAMICSEISYLSHERCRLIAGNVAARHSLLRASSWDSLACYSLAAHTTWSAAAAADIVAAQRVHVVNGSALAGKRLHWARCRRGLERRARRDLSQWSELADRQASWLV